VRRFFGPKKKVQLWVVGQYRGHIEDAVAWDFQGLFSSKEKAIEACVGDHYFCGPVVLDRKLPAKVLVWEGAYYPRLSGGPVPTPKKIKLRRKKKTAPKKTGKAKRR